MATPAAGAATRPAASTPGDQDNHAAGDAVNEGSPAGGAAAAGLRTPVPHPGGSQETNKNDRFRPASIKGVKGLKENNAILFDPPQTRVSICALVSSGNAMSTLLAERINSAWYFDILAVAVKW